MAGNGLVYSGIGETPIFGRLDLLELTAERVELLSARTVRDCAPSKEMPEAVF